MKYDNEHTLSVIKKETQDIDKLYKAKCVNWSGKTSDLKEFYSEVVANELLSNIQKFDKIDKVIRTSTYCRDNHCKISYDLCVSNRDEEIFCKRIIGLELPNLGLIMDYQVPLKDKKENSGLGKIDLISFNHDTKTIYLIELKYNGNDETLLRAVLEIFTYSKIVDQDKLKNDYLNEYKFRINKFPKDINSNIINIIPAVLLTFNCNPYNELIELESDERPKLKALVKSLGVEIFSINVACDKHVP